MVVKEKRGRRRYIAFTLDEKFTKETFIAKLRSFTPPDKTPYVVQCSSGWAILRSAPKDVPSTIEIVSMADPTSKSLLTSGTLITLRERFPVLAETRPPARR